MGNYYLDSEIGELKRYLNYLLDKEERGKSRPEDVYEKIEILDTLDIKKQQITKQQK